MAKSKVMEDKIYSALKLIECLCSQGKVPKYIFKNILDDYKGVVNIDDFQCCDYT